MSDNIKNMNTNIQKIRPITYRQKQAVMLWLRGGRKSKADALRKAGYSNAIVRQPHKVFGSAAVMNELDMLGYGTSGILNGQKPKKITQPIKTEVKNTFDISSLTKEMILDLKDKLARVPPYNTVTSIEKDIYKGNSHVPSNDISCNMFGEKLSDSFV